MSDGVCRHWQERDGSVKARQVREALNEIKAEETTLSEARSHLRGETQWRPSGTHWGVLEECAVTRSVLEEARPEWCCECGHPVMQEDTDGWMEPCCIDCWEVLGMPEIDPHLVRH